MPGHQAQMDWKDTGRRTIDGKRQRVYAFTMCLGLSRAAFTVHTTSMDHAIVLNRHVVAFRHFGTTRRERLVDGLKAMLPLSESFVTQK